MVESNYGDLETLRKELNEINEKTLNALDSFEKEDVYETIVQI